MASRKWAAVGQSMDVCALLLFLSLSFIVGVWDTLAQTTTGRSTWTASEG